MTFKNVQDQGWYTVSIISIVNGGEGVHTSKFVKFPGKLKSYIPTGKRKADRKES